ncbi:unnamed protein product [Pocillopora meandrina]|uniref:Endonuclease/exonuclease/phosphatase domain-containing protein n=1 Tax=Pocillopora meandrina TaxID=46732 RepID=A0AAU9WSI6_9CNID|nr:unnamed protein product [Pocillopora meandrina]
MQLMDNFEWFCQPCQDARLSNNVPDNTGDSSDIEALWIQVKFPTNTTLFSVIYRSELESTNFFESFRGALEKAWLKTDSIFILGDFNCYFKKDIERIPFHVLDIFEDKDDVLWGWNLLFNDVCDAHAPYKDVKVRSVCSPWINSEIRLKMNKRFKLFKVATRTKRSGQMEGIQKIT